MTPESTKEGKMDEDQKNRVIRFVKALCAGIEEAKSIENEPIDEVTKERVLGSIKMIQDSYGGLYKKIRDDNTYGVVVYLKVLESVAIDLATTLGKLCGEGLFVKACELADARAIPAHSKLWAVTGEDGKTVAHYAAIHGLLPYGFEQWGLPDKHGFTVRELWDVFQNKGEPKTEG
jgi:hypothetical protein